MAHAPDSKVFEIKAKNSPFSSLIFDPLLPRGVVRNFSTGGADAGVVFGPALLLAPKVNAVLAAAADEGVDAVAPPKLKVGFA